MVLRTKKYPAKICIQVFFMLIWQALFAQSPISKDTLNTGSPVPLPELCEKVKPFAAATSGFSKTAQFQAALATIKKETAIDPHREYIVSFGKDSRDSIISSPVFKGTKSNGVVPFVSNGFADLHNHPRNTPPSSGDLYGLIIKTGKTNQYKSRFVYTSGGDVYAFIVIDTVAVRTFITKYPPQQVEGYSMLFPDKLLDEYREMQQRYGVTEEMAMAYMLQHYNAGIVLLKQKSNGKFSLLNTTSSGSGDARKFTSATCPD